MFLNSPRAINLKEFEATDPGAEWKKNKDVF